MLKRTLFALSLTLTMVVAPSSFGSATVKWSSSTQLSGVVTIPAGQVVSVAAKTNIKVAAGTSIVIDGTLSAPAGLTLSGENWSGLVVNGSATLTQFNESGAQRSFQVGTNGHLTIHGGTISGVAGASQVEGLFVADHLDYDKGSGGGINASNGTGSITIDRSTLHGSGPSSGDFFGMYNVKSISLTNSKMVGSHCAFHVLALQNMALKSDQIQGNSYGFMMYGSSKTGTKTIENTTITENNFGFDEGSSMTRNGAITISHSFIKGNDQDFGLFTGKVKVVAPLTKSSL